MTTATMGKTHDPALAKEFFEDEMSFTTGPVELNRMIETGENITIIDVRAEEDYREGHVPGAINLPQDQWQTLHGLDKNKTNVVYCYSIVCHLAKKACLEFATKGYPVMELDGGIDEWREHDLPLEK